MNRTRGLLAADTGYSRDMTDRYFLHDLPFAYDALDPWCPAETLELHHGKHHAAYVAGANAAAEALDTVDPGDAYQLAGVQTALTFNVAGHVLHSLFWESLAPEKCTPTGDLKSQIEADFGSTEHLADLLRAECKGVQGSGWGALLFDPMSKQLQVASLHDHQMGVTPNSSMLAVIDVWEHAYYLKHRNDRASWVKAVVDHLDWSAIGSRFAVANSALTLTS
jgi:superoxide dismutase, Fe-Mn family